MLTQVGRIKNRPAVSPRNRMPGSHPSSVALEDADCYCQSLSRNEIGEPIDNVQFAQLIHIGFGNSTSWRIKVGAIDLFTDR